MPQNAKSAESYGDDEAADDELIEIEISRDGGSVRIEDPSGMEIFVLCIVLAAGILALAGYLWAQVETSRAKRD